MSHTRKKMKTGKIVSASMDKTVVVSSEWRQPHRLYKKNVKKRNRFVAHDSENECQIGDTVLITETRPISRTKRWKVTEILQRGEVLNLDEAESVINEGNDATGEGG